MVHILRLVTIDGIEESIRAVFGGANIKDLKPILSILVGAGLVELRDDFFYLRKGNRSFLEFEGANVSRIKADVMQYYQKYRPGIYRRFLKLPNAS
jgi:hypothetical protein